MAQTRTAKGTVAVKTPQTTLTLVSVASVTGRTLIVGVTYASGTVHPDSVKWGNKDMKLVAGSRISQSGITTALYKKRVHRDRTRDIVVTWPSAMGAKAMFCSEITEAGKKDVGQTNGVTATGSPATGAAVTSTVANTLHIAAFGSKGPSSDTPGTAGVGHTLGQRVGTTGAPPASNVTIQETFEILTVTGNTRATLSGATSRDWANSIIAFKATQTFKVDDAFYSPHDANPGQEAVVMVMEDESTVRKFTLRIERERFEEMTDQEVTDEITAACSWWADKQIDDETSPDFAPDAAFDSRVAAFVDDEVTV